MKLNTLKTPLIGAGIVIICYFFPWMKIDLSALDFGDLLPNKMKLIKSVSGLDMTGNAIVLLSFIAGLAIIVICLYTLYEKTPWKSRIPVLICSVVGCLFILLTLLRFMQGINEGMKLAGDILESSLPDANLKDVISLQFGGFGAAIGFIVALIGALGIPKSGYSVPTDNEPDYEIVSGDEEE